jgi:RHS repeat-associated protein
MIGVPALVASLLSGAVPAAVAAQAIRSAGAAPAVPQYPVVHGDRVAPHQGFQAARGPAQRSAPPAPHTWPAAGSGVVTVGAAAAAGKAASAVSAAGSASAASAVAGRVRVPGTPVFVQPVAGAQGPSQVAAAVESHAVSTRLGVTGVVFRAAAKRGSGRVTVGLDYSSFAGAYGGNYGSRLRLVQLPACALTTPQLGRCQAARPVRGAVNLPAQRTLSATVALPSAAAVVLAATTTFTSGNADGGGDGGGTFGSYMATSLKPSGSWALGGATGDFTYSYPITLPPAASGAGPKVILSYDSGSADGQTSATQAQANWLGDGWSTPQNFVEQSYVPCSGSPEGKTAPHSTSDMCYDGQVLTMSLNGMSTSIVYDASGSAPKYVLAQDNGDVVSKVTGSNNGTTSNDTSYWVVTDRSGTSYYFGRNQLPGWQSGSQATNSVDYEPVFSSQPGDPCYNATWSQSVCNMAYRWNLDYVVDAHGNAMAWYYHQDTNAYLENAAPTYTTKPNANATYVRDSYLLHVDYGFTAGNAYTVNGGHAPDQVVFSTSSTGRCDPTATSCPAITSSNSGTATSDYPDVPYDLNCTLGSGGCLVSSPSYWSTAELAGITTQQWTGSAYTPVDTWAFTQKFPPTGDGSSPTLFLQSITRTGKDTTAGGTAQSLWPVTFTWNNTLDNRVNPTGAFPAMTRSRINSITTETGSVITVAYKTAATCTSADQADPSSNTGSCFPVWWTPPGQTALQKDWFNKYQVGSVTQSDPAGGAPSLSMSYAYVGGAAWHYDDNELVKLKYRTYGQYRGFGDVQTFTGTNPDAQAETETTYYRGMSHDNSSNTSSAPAVTLKDSQGSNHDDADQLSGQPLEVTQYNYAGGPVTSSSIYSYWVSAAAATRDRSAVSLPALTANATGQVEAWARRALQSGTTTTWRVTENDVSFYADPASQFFGLPRYTYTHGDLSLSGNSQARCIVAGYEPPSAAGNIVGLASEVATYALPCGGTSPAGASAPASAAQVNALAPPANPSLPGDVVSDTCTLYDNPAQAKSQPQAPMTGCPTAPPTLGDASVAFTASGYTTSGGTTTPVFQPQSATVYDSFGRVTDAWDAKGNHTQTAYTDNSFGITTGVTSTNPLGQKSSSTVDPLRGIATGTSDINAVTTTTQYDGLGRVIAEWKDSRAPPAAANATFSYSVSNTTAPTVVTTSVLNDSANTATATTLYDSLLRVRQTQYPTPKGGRVVTDNFYDSRGWKWKVNTNWYDGNNAPGATLATVNGQAIPDSQVPSQTVIAFDGLGQPVLTTVYDKSHVRSQAATIYDQDAPYSYDQGTATTGDETITIPLDATGKPYSGGAVTATVGDALGRTVRLYQYTTLPTVTITATAVPAITTVSASGGTTQATDYAYSTVGNQTGVTDEATGQTWTKAYDLLGRVTSSTGADSKTTTYAYDANDNRTQSTDALGNTLTWTYDALNRQTSESAATTTQPTPALVNSWVYDNSNNVAGVTRPNGQLTTATHYMGGASGDQYVEQYTGFNAFGEPLGENITLPPSEGSLGTAAGGTTPYKFTYSYLSVSGSPNKTTYPASPGTGLLPKETVATAYFVMNGLQLPGSVTGSVAYSLNTAYTALGQVGQEQIGTTSVNAFITNAYDENTGQLTDTNLKNTAISSTPIDDTAYAYDAGGNPTSQAETRQGTTSETQCFAYDTLDRLKQAWTATDSCGSDPSSNAGQFVGDGVTGAAYWTSWTYNPLGTRGSETDHGLSGAPDATVTYKYNQNGQGQPDTLTSTSTSSPASVTGTSAFGYDANGNVTSRSVTTGSATTSQQLTWNPDGTLATIATTPATGSATTSSYVYDANGTLLLQKDPGQTILYLPGEELILDTSTGANAGTISGTRYYPLPGGGQVVRTATPAGNGYVYQLGDKHGTATLTIGPALTAAVTTWREFTPYGGSRGPAVTWVDNRGFLNKPGDASTGLTDIGARWYDPVTGAFQSLDPVFEADSPQEQNGYGYAADDPIGRSDPTGLMPICDGPCPVPSRPSAAAQVSLSWITILYQMLYKWQAKNGAAKPTDDTRTIVHNLVVIDTAIGIAATAPAHDAVGTLSLDFGQFSFILNKDGSVSFDLRPPHSNDIPGARKGRNSEVGKADIMLTVNDGQSDQIVYIWEIKGAGQEKAAQTQLKDYVDHKQGGVAGWWLPNSVIPDGKNGYIRAKTAYKENTESNEMVGTGIRTYEDYGQPSKQGGNQPPSPSDWLWGLLGLGLAGSIGAGVSTGGGTGAPAPQPGENEPVHMNPLGVVMPFAA